MLAVMQAAKGNGKEVAQVNTSTMPCYCCGQYGHWSNNCKNQKNFELVAQVLKAQGRNPFEHCGRFGHPPRLCWKLPENAHLHPQNPNVNQYGHGSQNVNQYGQVMFFAYFDQMVCPHDFMENVVVGLIKAINA
jgi:hypothetical protein